LLQADANGVQIYVCRVVQGDPQSRQWVFRAPEADLFDSKGKKIGKHYAGPTWELPDGSKVVGKVIAQEKAPDEEAIPWLLLAAKETSAQGILSRTQTIQRLATVGGKAPGMHCDPGDEGHEFRAPYRATYYFYAAQ
jgi:hypothetical protein